MIILLVVLHLILLFCAVVVVKIAENADIIDDPDFPLVISIFLPLVVMVFVGALWLGEVVSYKLT